MDQGPGPDLSAPVRFVRASLPEPTEGTLIGEEPAAQATLLARGDPDVPGQPAEAETSLDPTTESDEDPFGYRLEDSLGLST